MPVKCRAGERLPNALALLLLRLALDSDPGARLPGGASQEMPHGSPDTSRSFRQCCRAARMYWSAQSGDAVTTLSSDAATTPRSPHRAARGNAATVLNTAPRVLTANTA